MKIRQATPADLQDIAEIHVQSWKDSYTKDLPVEFMAEHIDRVLRDHWRAISIQKEDIVLVAEEDSPIGFIAIWCRPVPFFIDNLHVKPLYRSKKTGTALMEAAAEKLLKKGHKTAYLWVFASNEKAIRFYEKLGGMQKEQAQIDVFGYEVLSQKMEWEDLSLIGAKPALQI